MSKLLNNISFMLLLLALSFNASSQHKSTVTDIDGNEYQSVVIGNQEWFTKNLRVTRFNNSDEIPNIQSVTDWTSGNYPLKWVNYNNNADNDAIYGKLYDGRVATDDRNVCPDGWHVATKDDWDELIAYLGGAAAAANKLMDSSGDYWETPNNATNESGFSAVPNGYRASDGTFLSLPFVSEIWTATNASSITNNYVYIHYSGSVSISDGMPYGVGRAIRCIKNSEATVPDITTVPVTSITKTTASAGGDITNDGGATITAKGVVWSTSPNPTIDLNNGITSDGDGSTAFSSSLSSLEPATKYYVRAYAINSAGTGYGNEFMFTTFQNSAIEDIEGNLYNTVTIGQQVWMAENLRTTKYATGTSIATGLDNTTWQNTAAGAYAVYPHADIDGLNSEDEVVQAYGLLYNWFAATSADGVCPAGWKVPSANEWNELLAYLVNQGYSNDSYASTNGVGNALKSCRQVDAPSGGDCATSQHPRWNYFADQHGTDAYGFNGLPAGSRMSTGEYLNVGNLGRFWTSEEADQYNAYRRDLGYGNGRLSEGSITKTLGISIRCIKEVETQVEVPTLTTASITSIAQTSASSGGEVTSTGGADVTARGVCWSTSENPTIADSKTEDGAGVGTFTSNITGLTPNTTYYVRAYATNSAGTGYGEQVEFKTLQQVSALALPFTEDCEGDVSGWTTYDEDNDGNKWGVSTDYPRTGSKHFSVRWNSSVTNNDWLVSPLLALPADKEITLKFWARSTLGTLLESFDVKIIDADGTAHIASVVDVPYEYTEYTFDLTTYAGKEVCFAIVCVSKDKFYLCVDDISCLANTTVAPVAAFSANPTSGTAPVKVQFTDQSTNTPTSWEWSFGDGGTSTEQNPEYTYSTEGTYTVSLKVTNATGSSTETKTNYIAVAAPVVAPTVVTMNVTNISQTEASSGGSVSSDGGASISAKGVVWSTTQNPSLESNSGSTSNGTGTAEFTSEITGLAASTTYYVRAYATNSAGTGYGEQKTFTTTATSAAIDVFTALSAFPNPFSESITIENEVGLSNVCVMSVSGQRVFNQVASGETKLTIETSSLQQGIYILSVRRVDGSLSNIRVVKH